MIEFKRASAHELPLAVGCVDLVFMSQFYHHLSDPFFWRGNAGASRAPAVTFMSAASSAFARFNALHSITSSARASIVGGMVRPSAFAVFRLITNSKIVGCSTGRSAGLAPFKILST